MKVLNVTCNIVRDNLDIDTIDLIFYQFQRSSDRTMKAENIMSRFIVRNQTIEKNAPKNGRNWVSKLQLEQYEEAAVCR